MFRNTQGRGNEDNNHLLTAEKTVQLLLDTCIHRQVCMMIKNDIILNCTLACQRSSTHKMPNKNVLEALVFMNYFYTYTQ